MNDRSWLKSQNYEGRYPCSFVLDVDVVPTSVSVILRRGTFVNSDKFRLIGFLLHTLRGRRWSHTWSRVVQLTASGDDVELAFTSSCQLQTEGRKEVDN